MKVKVKLLSVFAAHAREDADGLTTVRDRGTVRALAETLGLPLDQVRIITVNGRQVFLDEPLSDGDEVLIFPPAFGGG
jgi:sulfur carrier protein/molybdopterin synthase sulfur carrier subunit